MNVYELTLEQRQELKCNYIAELVNAGTFAEVIGRDYNEPSYSDLYEADEIISDETIFEHYKGFDFVDDDFFCSANI